MFFILLFFTNKYISKKYIFIYYIYNNFELKNMDSIILVVLLILIVLITYKSLNSVKRKRPTKHKMYSEPPSYYSADVERTAVIEGDTMTQRGLNELEQDTRSRGIVPEADQPNHIANLWKCDAEIPIKDCAYSSPMVYDYDTQLRDKVVNMDQNENLNMHVLSRFGSTCS